MAKKRHTGEQIISKLREAEILLSKGTKMPQVCRKIGITEQTYYRWRKEYGGVRTDQVKRFKEVEKENVRLKKIVADLTLDNAILKEAAYPNF
jgi:transposase-like protein